MCTGHRGLEGLALWTPGHSFMPRQALQEQLRLLEEENEQLREEVRMGQRACSWAEGVDSPAPSFLTPGLST